MRVRTSSLPGLRAGARPTELAAIARAVNRARKRRGKGFPQIELSCIPRWVRPTKVFVNVNHPAAEMARLAKCSWYSADQGRRNAEPSDHGASLLFS